MKSFGILCGDQLGLLKLLYISEEKQVLPEAAVATWDCSTTVQSVNLDSGSSRVFTTSCSKGDDSCMLNVLQLENDEFQLLESKEVESLETPGSIVNLGTGKIGVYDNMGHFEAFEEASPKKTKITGPVSKVIRLGETDNIAFGGKENDLRVFDCATNKQVFKARNVPHDNLDMRVPIWITDLTCFKKRENVVVTCTGYSQIRLYDTRAQRRPVKDVKVDDWSHMTCIKSVDDDSFIIADVTGNMARLDLSTMRSYGNYKGSAGSIRSIDVHNSEGFVVSAGLDRHVRVYDLESRRLYGKAYVKQKVNDVKFVPSLVNSSSAKRKRVEIDPGDANSTDSEDEVTEDDSSEEDL